MLLTVKDIMVVPGHDLQCREGGADVSVIAVVDLHRSRDFMPMWGVHMGLPPKRRLMQDGCRMLPITISGAVRCSTASGLTACLQTALQALLSQRMHDTYGLSAPTWGITAKASAIPSLAKCVR